MLRESRVGHEPSIVRHKFFHSHIDGGYNLLYGIGDVMGDDMRI